MSYAHDALFSSSNVKLVFPKNDTAENVEKVKDVGPSLVVDKIAPPCNIRKSENPNVKQGEGRPSFQNLLESELTYEFQKSRSTYGIDSLTGKIHGGSTMVDEEGRFCKRIAITLNKSHWRILNKFEDDVLREEKRVELFNNHVSLWKEKGWFQTGETNDRQLIGFCPVKLTDRPYCEVMRTNKEEEIELRVLTYDRSRLFCEPEWKNVKDVKQATYEICGEKFNKNVHGFKGTLLVEHGIFDLSEFHVFKEFYNGDQVDVKEIREFFKSHPIGQLYEGFVIKSGPNYFKVHRGHLDLGEFKQAIFKVNDKEIAMSLPAFYNLHDLPAIKSSCDHYHDPMDE
jgi:hypothetical protein